MEVINYRNKLIVKSNDLIESKYHLSVREQKFLVFLASLVKKDDIDYKYTSVKIKDIEQVLKMSDDKKWGSIYEVVREIVLNINKKPLTIRKPNGGWVIINWFTTVDADPTKGLVTFELSSAVKSQLVQLNEYFTKYRFENILVLKSGYSIRIYELLKLNQYKQKVTYDLDFFRELIGVSYKDEKGRMIHKYAEYKALKRSVIKHAQAELKRETDIYFELKETRENRKVTSLTFYVFKNHVKRKKAQQELFSQPTIAVEEDDNYQYNGQIIQRFIQLGFQKQDAHKLYQEGFNKIEDNTIRKQIVNDGRSLDEYFLEKVEYVEQAMKDREVGNPAGLLVKAIQGDYRNKEAGRKALAKKRQKAEAEKHKKRQALEGECRRLQQELMRGEREAVERLLGDKGDGLFEELFKNAQPQAWRGYDDSVSLRQNFERSRPSQFVHFKVMDGLRKAHPELFKPLEESRERIRQLRKEISGL